MILTTFLNNRAEGDDLLGDAYEYLMRHFATESGKSKGQFYTPAEVSRIMAKVVGIGNAKNAAQSVHDPTCGSGSLLLKANDEAKSRTGLDLALYGQEMDVASAALARMNTILHDCPSAEIWRDNTATGRTMCHRRSAGGCGCADRRVGSTHRQEARPQAGDDAGTADRQDKAGMKPSMTAIE
jgi:type I restriction-modification system DNA methylase subunit